MAGIRNREVDVVTVTCKRCKAEYELPVTEKELTELRNSDMVPVARLKKAFPELSDNARDLLTAEVCRDCYMELFTGVSKP